ncbi:MAG: phospholipase A [Porticoccus sp.]|nr:phospholipase A [Porticoccus sp.]
MIYRLITLILLLMLLPVSYAQEGISNEAEVGGDSALAKRLKGEEKVALSSFVITPHRPNYILPYTYNSNLNSTPYDAFVALDPDANKIDESELKYQLSFKIPLIMGLFHDKANLWVGYTQVSYWQLYNSDSSSPFRETNYEPEMLLDIRNDYKIFDFTLSHVVLGFNHQSNGRSEPLSRSWNRITANFVFEKNNFVMYLKPWYRLPEDDEDDNNPDIEKYLGYGDYGASYKHNDQVYSILLRNNFRSDDNLTSVQLDWSVPINGRLKFYTQYINGYGDGLVDYNHRNRRIGFGIMLTDWL